jgi:hypothetical protein
MTDNFEEHCLELSTALSVFNEGSLYDSGQRSKEHLATTCPDGVQQENDELDREHEIGWAVVLRPRGRV